jgi:hypothetical protein
MQVHGATSSPALIFRGAMLDLHNKLATQKAYARNGA